MLDQTLLAETLLNQAVFLLRKSRISLVNSEFRLIILLDHALRVQANVMRIYLAIMDDQMQEKS